MTDGKFQFNDANGFVTSYTSTSTLGLGDGGGGDSTAIVVDTSSSTTTSYTTSSSSSSSSSTQLLPFQINAIIPPRCPPSTTNTVNIGYYQSWARYRSTTCNPILPSQIPIAQFGYTHLIYSFAGISHGGTIDYYNGVGEEKSIYDEFNALKSTTTDSGGGLKTLIAVGGWNMDQTLFTKVAATSTSRLTFAMSVRTFLQTHEFDGIDLDWEYPVTRQGSVEDYNNYVLLCQTLRQVLDDASEEYLLTMAIPINPQKIQDGYNLKELSKYVHWFHLMTYDIHGSWDAVAGSNTDMAYISNTIEHSIMNQGVAGHQLVFGMASYGRSMKLTDQCTTNGCPIDGPGYAGCSGEQGFSPYFELKENYVDKGNYESLLLNEETQSMEMVLKSGDGNGNVFVSLDLEDTFVLKREYYLSK